MQQQFLTDRQTAEFFGVSKPTLWRYAKRDDFPQPIKLGPGCTRWNLKELEEYAERLRGEA